MAAARDRYLLVSWGRSMRDHRVDPAFVKVVDENKWVNGELLVKDPAVDLGRRNTSLRGWDDECMIAVPAP